MKSALSVAIAALACAGILALWPEADNSGLPRAAVDAPQFVPSTPLAGG